jgi:hypothetical protein
MEHAIVFATPFPDLRVDIRVRLSIGQQVPGPREALK